MAGSILSAVVTNNFPSVTTSGAISIGLVRRTKSTPSSFSSRATAAETAGCINPGCFTAAKTLCVRQTGKKISAEDTRKNHASLRVRFIVTGLLREPFAKRP